MTLPSDLPVSMPPQKPPRPGLLGLTMLAVIAVLSLVGCAAAPVVPTDAPAIIVTASGGAALEACRQIANADVGDLPLMRSIGLIGVSTRDNDSIRIAGGILQQAADVAMHGTANRDPDATRMVADVGGDARFLRRTCVEQHLLAS